MKLYIARNISYGREYCLFQGKPHYLDALQLWESVVSCIYLPASQSPVKLKPGEGPVEVELKVVKKKGPSRRRR